ncbi:MAG: hypothetical protein KJ600_05740 [Nanoarchaeota archaeon]|nr:hypothetical protein [Nanoarchaeota archaeon]MBU1104031.1 hypothetical protein [Nanoarchaeota archaeon]
MDTIKFTVVKLSDYTGAQKEILTSNYYDPNILDKSAKEWIEETSGCKITDDEPYVIIYNEDIKITQRGDGYVIKSLSTEQLYLPTIKYNVMDERKDFSFPVPAEKIPWNKMLAMFMKMQYDDNMWKDEVVTKEDKKMYIDVNPGALGNYPETVNMDKIRNLITCSKN